MILIYDMVLKTTFFGVVSVWISGRLGVLAFLHLFSYAQSEGLEARGMAATERVGKMTVGWRIG